MITYPDGKGTLQFSSLSAGSYLLEIHIGDQMLYQRKLVVEGNLILAVPVGQLKVVDRATIDARGSQSLSGSEFKSNVILAVGNLDKNVRLNSKPITLSIISGGKLLRATLFPPKLAISFNVNGQPYLLTGSIRQSGNKTVFDCEVSK